MSKRPETVYRVSDKRFGVAFNVTARTKSAAYSRYLTLANKSLKPTKKTIVKRHVTVTGTWTEEVTTCKVRMLGHAPTDSDTGGWRGVSISVAA